MAPEVAGRVEMIQSLLITLREGLEAALIVGIVLAYLRKCGQAESRKSVWIGVVLAILGSLIVGGIIAATTGHLEGRAEEIFEGVAMLIAAAVLTWMVFWMRKRAKTIRRDLEFEVNQALQLDSSLALSLLAFVAVMREGVETALFLFAASRTASPIATLTGSILGLAIAIALGALLYRGLRVLNLRMIFNVTGLLLILFASGVLAHGLHELQEAHIVPVLVEEIWNTNTLLDDKSTVGRFTASLLGYNGNPSLVEAASYFVYLFGALSLYFRSKPRPGV